MAPQSSEGEISSWAMPPPSDPLAHNSLVINTASTVTASGNVIVGNGGTNGDSLTVSGANTTLTNNGILMVGNGGLNATATFSDSAVIQSGQLFVGNTLGSTGSLDINNASVTTTDWTVLGRSAGTATVTLEGNSVWTKSGVNNFVVADGYQGDGVGTFTVKDSAKLDIQSGEFWIGAEGSSAVNGTFNLVSGDVETNSWVAVGRNHTTGTLNISGGTFNVNAVGAFGSGQNFTSEGSANGVATINQSGGVFNNLLSDTILGESNDNVADSVAVWNATGGTSNHNVVRLGGNGNGTMNISGTAVVNAPTIYVSSNPGSDGALNVSGGTLNLGHLEAGAGNTHTVSFDGGQVNATNDDPNYIRDFNTGDVNIKAGGLNLNTAEHTVAITTQLSGVGGITKTGLGTLQISLPSNGPADANTFSGTNFVNEGTLEAVDTNLGSGDVHVAAGAHLVLDINTAISDFAQIVLVGTTSTVALNYASGEIDTIGGLNVNGVIVAPGTYSASDLNGMFSGQFSGDGSVTVVPEPSTVALAVAGLGAVFFLRRRTA